jgi:hypothetical protein
MSGVKKTFSDFGDAMYDAPGDMKSALWKSTPYTPPGPNAEEERRKQLTLGMQTQKSQSYGLQRTKRAGITAAKAMALIDQPQQPQTASKTLLGY